MGTPRIKIALLVLYTAGAAALAIGAVRQRAALNLSATAGGQYPYLVYARGIAREGVTRFVGDRNRMPALPALVSLVHDDDWPTFVKRASALSIALSMILLAGVALIAHRILRPFSAAAVTLSAGFSVCLGRASFVQAEPTFYVLFLLSWWLSIRYLRRPGIGRAVVCGVALAVTFLTKASALPLLPALVLFTAIAAGSRVFRWGPHGSGKRPASWTTVLIAVGVFGLLTSPYLAENKARFGRLFYNVNSTFFMWCDSWREASALAEAHDITTAYPDAPPDEIPGPMNYWRSHSLGEIGARMSYGLGVLVRETCTKRFGVYLACGALLCGAAAVGRGGRRIGRLCRSFDDRLILIFCVLISAGYIFLYAWYVPIGYGDRFIQSLFMPVMCAMLFVMERLAGRRRALRSLRLSDALAIALCGIVLIDAAALAVPAASTPPPHFVEFYYNESVERERVGDDAEARRGYAGVFRIDPTFIASVGRGALETGRFADAVDHLRRAAELEADSAVLFNDLGSALVQSDRPVEAVAALERATTLDPNLAVAWFNLGGTLIGIGRTEDASAVIARLTKLDPRLARQLNDLMPSHLP
jgi:hypothetical protein